MANINELEWATVEGSDYPVTKTTIAELEVSITKYDEDSFVLKGNEKEHEVDFRKLKFILSTDDITWSESDAQYDPTADAIITIESAWNDNSIWKSVKGVGEAVLEMPHIPNGEGVTLRIIKLDEDSFKVAVIGIPPNDGEEIHYGELGLRDTLTNYAYALGLGISIGDAYYYSLLKSSAQADYEIVETEHTDFEIVPDEVPCVDCH